MQTKRHKLTKRKAKMYKGGAEPDPEPKPEPTSTIINEITADLKVSPGLKTALIMFGLSSVYILNKLLINY